MAGGSPNWAIASTPSSGCTASSDGPVKLVLVASRVSGVAPLAVFFDATGTTTSSTARPFHDLEYRWDFGDPAAGAVWTAGSRTKLSSRNAATGPVAAHVFEAAGIYTVTVGVVGTAAKASCSIAVQDPDVVFAGSGTICFSTSGDFVGCPAGAERFKTSDFAATTNSASAYNKTRRLLLRRGETWAATKTATLKAPGPGIIGAFGSGAPPTIEAVINGNVLQLSGANDWRIVDLSIVGNQGNGQRGFRSNTSASQITFLRTSVANLDLGFLFGNTAADDAIAIVESTITDSGSHGMLVGGTRFAILGNVVRNVRTEHVFRSGLIVKGVISNNDFSGGVAGKHVIKLHAPRNGTGFSEQIVISDNYIRGGNAAWAVSLGPQSGNPPNNNEVVREVIIERNWFQAGAGTQRALVVNASGVSIRNNICDMTKPGRHGGSCIAAFTRGAEPAPDRLNIYNNSGHSADSGDFSLIEFPDATATNVAIRNNLAYAPRSAKARLIQGTLPPGLVQSHNSSDDQVVRLAPGWIGPVPNGPGDFRLKAESPYIDAGTAVPVFSDFSRANRPRAGGFDLGAMER